MNILAIVVTFLVIIGVAKLANFYQAKWQRERDERELIEESARLLAKWGSRRIVDEGYIKQVNADVEAYVAEVLAHRAAEFIPDVVTDEDLIGVALEQLHREAAYNGPPAPPLPTLTEDVRKARHERAKPFLKKWENDERLGTPLQKKKKKR